MLLHHSPPHAAEFQLSVKLLHSTNGTKACAPRASQTSPSIQMISHRCFFPDRSTVTDCAYDPAHAVPNMPTANSAQKRIKSVAIRKVNSHFRSGHLLQVHRQAVAAERSIAPMTKWSVMDQQTSLERRSAENGMSSRRSGLRKRIVPTKEDGLALHAVFMESAADRSLFRSMNCSQSDGSKML